PAAVVGESEMLHLQLKASATSQVVTFGTNFTIPSNEFTSTWTSPNVNGLVNDFYFQSTGSNGWVEVAGPNIVAAGTITGVTAGAGMSGGGTSGNVTLTAGSAAVTGAVKSNGSGTYGQAAASDLSNGVTGSGAVVLAASPTLTTPQLGVATVTTLAGKNAISSITLGAAAQVGTGATAVCNTGHVCDSVSGEVLLTTGTGTLSAGLIYTINFADTRANAPNCVVSIIEKSGPAFGTNPLSTTTTSSLSVTGIAALTASTAYTEDYICGGD